MVTLTSKRGPLKVWCCGDLHIGAETHDALLFARHYARAVVEGWLMINLGDSLELVTPSSRVAQRGALREQTMTVEQQRKVLCQYLRGLAGGILLPGNHDYRVDMATGLDFTAMMAELAGPKWQVLPHAGFVRLNAGKQSYTAYCHHGEGPVVSPTSLFDRLQRDTGDLDLILAGHIHAGTFDPAFRMTPEGGKVVHRIRTGHYLKPPRYALDRPISRIGPCGSWLLTFDAKHHLIESTWLQ